VLTRKKPGGKGSKRKGRANAREGRETRARRGGMKKRSGESNWRRLGEEREQEREREREREGGTKLGKAQRALRPD